MLIGLFNHSDLFASGTIRVDTYDQALRGITLIYNIFFDSIPVLYASMPKENITIIEIDWEPITSLWLKASAAKGPNALGLDPSKSTFAMLKSSSGLVNGMIRLCTTGRPRMKS